MTSNEDLGPSLSGQATESSGVCKAGAAHSCCLHKHTGHLLDQIKPSVTDARYPCFLVAHKHGNPNLLKYIKWLTKHRFEKKLVLFIMSTVPAQWPARMQWCSQKWEKTTCTEEDFIFAGLLSTESPWRYCPFVSEEDELLWVCKSSQLKMFLWERRNLYFVH